MVQHSQIDYKKHPHLETLNWLQTDVNDILEYFVETPILPLEKLQSLELSDWFPKVDIYETAKEIKVTVEIPGLNEKDVKVDMSDKKLIIRGEKKDERKEKRENNYLIERNWGTFVRSFEIPVPIDKDNIHATFDKGILTIILPKSQTAQSGIKRIEIKPSQASA
jgi:HSP20 family protein